jgi:hydroxymethylglutaryl-CoA reductase (NADPH)
MASPQTSSDQMLEQARERAQQAAVRVRRDRIADLTRTDLAPIGIGSVSPRNARGHVENFVGVAQVPLGVAGPLHVRGDHACGDYWIPFATTEGTLVATYDAGMRAINAAGGATAFVGDQQLDITPVFTTQDLAAARSLADVVRAWTPDLVAAAASTTSHGRLLDVRPLVIGRRVLARFSFDTGDAMGMNMVNIATDVACRLIRDRTGIPYYLRCNYSSDKKPSSAGLARTYGREAYAGVLLPADVMRATLGVTPEAFLDFAAAGNIGATAAGMLGVNAHVANGLAALFIACGQDVAQIVNASIAQVTAEQVGDAVHVAIRLPGLVVATVGGGTGLPTQRTCLAVMGCYGEGRVQAFAEITAATLLAGEIAIAAALTNGTFVEAHRRNRELTSHLPPQSPPIE